MTDYSRGDYADLPAGKTDLENNYTAPDLTAIASNDNSTYAEQTANNEIAIHQYKKTVTGQYTNITWSGKSSLAPSESPVIMEVYNVTGTPAWEELDRDDSTAADTDFDITYNNLATADYLDSGVITWRVYQAASTSSAPIARWTFDNVWTDAMGSYNLTPANTPTFDGADKQEGSHSAVFVYTSNQRADNASLHLPSIFTICFWMKMVSHTSNPAGLVGNIQTSGGCYGLWLNTGVNLYFTDDTDHNLGLAISDGYWYHIGVTIDETTTSWTSRIYNTNDSSTTDGGASTLAGTYTNTSAFRIGAFANNDTQYHYNGKIDQLVIFDSILTLDQIAQIRQGTYPF